MRAFIPARLAAMVPGVGIYWFLIADRCGSCAALDGPIKARSTSPTNPFPMMIPRAARVRDHNAMVQPGADWPEGI